MARNVLTKKGKAVRWEGIPELKANVNALLKEMGAGAGRRVGKNLKNKMLMAGLIVRDEIKDEAPVRDGVLKSAVFAARGDDTKPDVLVGVNQKIAPHAHLVENGGRGGEMPANPFFRRGMATARPTAARVVAEGLRDVIKDTLPK